MSYTSTISLDICNKYYIYSLVTISIMMISSIHICIYQEWKKYFCIGNNPRNKYPKAQLSSAEFNSDQHIQDLSGSGLSTVWFKLTYFLIWNQMDIFLSGFGFIIDIQLTLIPAKTWQKFVKNSKNRIWAKILLNKAQNLMKT